MSNNSCAPTRAQRRPMGADKGPATKPAGTAIPARRPPVRQRGDVAAQDWSALAGHPGAIWSLENTYNRFARWAKRGVWEKVFKALRVDDDVGSLIDGTVVRAHQDAAGGKGGADAMLWAALEEVFRPSSTRSPPVKGSRFTSSSRLASSTTRRKRST